MSSRLPVLSENMSVSFKTLPRVIDMSYLDETDIFGLLTEALTADHEAVLADDTSLMSAGAAAEKGPR